MLQETFISIILLMTFMYVVNSQIYRGRHDCSNSTINKTWRQGCNTCYCEKGIPFCSDLLCYLPRGVKQTKCSPGATWKKDCNYCVCKNNIPVCTSTDCPSITVTTGITSIKEKCPHGTIWKSGCNDCFCFFGLSACTVKLCDKYMGLSTRKRLTAFWNPTLIFQVGLHSNSQCIQGTFWNNSCNQCICSNGIAICTLKDCSQPDPLICINGTIWKKDCNECICSDGKTVCSKKNCKETSKNPTSTMQYTEGKDFSLESSVSTPDHTESLTSERTNAVISLKSTMTESTVSTSTDKLVTVYDRFQTQKSNNETSKLNSIDQISLETNDNFMTTIDC